MDDAFAILGSITPRIIRRSNMSRSGVEGLNIGEGRERKPRSTTGKCDSEGDLTKKVAVRRRKTWMVKAGEQVQDHHHP
jgi:hypothetical protein